MMIKISSFAGKPAQPSMLVNAVADKEENIPTLVVSPAILAYTRGGKTGFADDAAITPPHNPLHDGGFKYNPPDGGMANIDINGG